MAYIIEQAGGKSESGEGPTLDEFRKPIELGIC